MPIREVREALTRLGCGGSRLLLAVSGGIDSVTLCHVLHHLSQEMNLKLLIGHVNHGLRGPESEADQVAVEALAEQLDLEFEVARLAPAGLRGGLPSRDRPTLQEAARELRYGWLLDVAERRDVAHVVTAHTLDDQAETVLLRLLRGTGPDGLGGIPEWSRGGRLVRPLLGVSRSAIEQFAAERRLCWREDASNAQLDYTRNRLRHQWLPGLVEEFNPQLLRAIGNLAEAQRRDSEWMKAEVEREATARFTEEGSWLVIDAKDWGVIHEALARRLARLALERCGSGRLVSRVHLERVQRFLAVGAPGRRIELPGGLTLRRDSRGFRMGPLPS